LVPPSEMKVVSHSAALLLPLHRQLSRLSTAVPHAPLHALTSAPHLVAMQPTHASDSKVHALLPAAPVSKLEVLILAPSVSSTSAAVSAISPALPAPRDSVRASIDHWSAVYGVDPRLARATAWMESGFQEDVVSNVGAIDAVARASRGSTP